MFGNSYTIPVVTVITNRTNCVFFVSELPRRVYPCTLHSVHKNSAKRLRVACIKGVRPGTSGSYVGVWFLHADYQRKTSENKSQRSAGLLLGSDLSLNYI